MKCLIIYAHPNPRSLNGQIKSVVTDFLNQLGNEVMIRDLYQMNFNPVLSLEDLNGQKTAKVSNEVEQEQLYLKWADAIIFIYPIWWTGMPAILKGYIDRVFSYGFAYRYDKGVQKGLLTNKKTIVVNTHGKSTQEYHRLGMDKALTLTSDVGIFSYCGLFIKEHFFFDRADKIEKSDFKSWIEAIKKALLNLPKD